MRNNVQQLTSGWAILIDHKGRAERVLVDKEDLDRVNVNDRYGIYTDGAGRKLARSGKRSGQVFLHKRIVDLMPGDVLEWINGDTLDCRRENLRIRYRDGRTVDLVQQDQNSTYQALQTLAAEGNKPAQEALGIKRSDVPGVKWHKASQRWTVRVWKDGKRHSLGYFFSREEAEQQAAVFRREGPDSVNLYKRRGSK